MRKPGIAWREEGPPRGTPRRILIEREGPARYNRVMAFSPKAFVFDMDGVLLDTESMCDRVWPRCGERFGIPDGTIRELMREMLGVSQAGQEKILKERFGKAFDTEGFFRLFSEMFGELEQKEGISLMPYAKECLTYLKGKGYSLSLASSTQAATVRRQLKNAGLLDFFDAVTCGDTVKHSKPHPEIYLKACGALGLAPAVCAAVEDSPNGVLSASSAGLYTIMVPDRIPPTDEIRGKTGMILSDLSGIMKHF